MDDSRSASQTGEALAPPGSGPLSSAEWPARAADTVEQVVAAVHDRVVRPLVIAARAVVFGLLVATMVLILVVLFSIAVVRLLDVYAFGHRVWASDLVVGGFVTLLGLLAWSRRRARRPEES